LNSKGLYVRRNNGATIFVLAGPLPGMVAHRVLLLFATALRGQGGYRIPDHSLLLIPVFRFSVKKPE
jgi:hypothetical protein